MSKLKFKAKYSEISIERKFFAFGLGFMYKTNCCGEGRLTFSIIFSVLIFNIFLWRMKP